MKSRSRLTVCAFGLALLLGGFPSQADAKVKPRNFGSIQQCTSAIAIDPSGIPHVAYAGTDDHLHHAWLDGKKWQHELVDGTSEGARSSAIAVDSQGSVHIFYGAYRGLGAPKLHHAFHDGTGWTVTEVGVDGSNPHVQLDASGHPHVQFMTTNVGIGYARFDGESWQIEDTGLPGSWYSTGLAVDAEGHAHISYSVNGSGCFYATNGSGSWESTELVASISAATAIGLTPAGQPRVLIGSGSVLSYFSFDGASWTSETVMDFGGLYPGIQAIIDSHIAMAMDAEGRPQLLVPVYLTSGNRYVNVAVYVVDDGAGWNGLLLDVKNTGFYPSIALDEDGVAYATYCGSLIRERYAKAKWVRIALPDLTGEWGTVSVTGSTVTGTFTVRNDGLEASPKTTVALWLSDDTLLDEGDELLPVTLKVKSLKPGASVELDVELELGGSLAGKHLIAVVDPGLVTVDRNLLDNIVPVALGD